MAEPHVISALTKKRAELVGKLKECEKLVKECKKDINAIDHSILIFDNKYPLSSIKSKKTYQHKFFRQGEASRLIFGLLKEHSQLTNRKIYTLVAERKELDLSTETKRAFSQTVNNILKLLEKQGILETVDNSTKQIIWKIKDLELNT